MTGFEIAQLAFSAGELKEWESGDARRRNWPVVYVLDNASTNTENSKINDVYVGETLNALGRLSQHLKSREKVHLTSARVIVDETFNKSVCLDLESYLIRLLAGDGSYSVLNRNDGIVEADYFNRAAYRERFDEIFEELKAQGLFSRSIPEIENSDLFKLSPFKALTSDQAVAVEDILEGLLADIRSASQSTIVVQGDPGTGKTVVAVFLTKLLVDIAAGRAFDENDDDSMFSEFFVEGYTELLAGLKVGVVIPQQSLRKSVERVFKRTPGLNEKMVMTAFDVGKSAEKFDLLIVDEAHRLNQRANQPSGPQNKQFAEITTALFGTDDLARTQLDWIRAKSAHQILLVDPAQSVRPADLPKETLDRLVEEAKSNHRHYALTSQMRVRAGSDYVSYVRRVLSNNPAEPQPETVEGYDFRFFDDVALMRAEIECRDREYGLARLVAGFAWPWVTKSDSSLFDITIGEEKFRWNSTQTDWIASPGSLNEVGSIHTVQGYDLNYAGVIIGPDLRYSSDRGLYVDRESYFDKKGKENNKALGRTYTDDDLLRYISNIYAVLLTRGIVGTYLYVCDPSLREYLRPFFPVSGR